MADIMNSYSHFKSLKSADGATAAVVDILSSACSASDETNKVGLLTWASEDDNLKKLRDKIMDCASD